MLICLLTVGGVVLKIFLASSMKTVDEAIFREVLERLKTKVTRVRPGIARSWMLQHDNALGHTAISINEVLTRKCILCDC